MLGLSRLAYSLSTNRQIPSALGRLHPTRSTPYVVITIAALLAAGLTVPQDLEFLVGIFAFGALLGLTIAHLSIVVLRYKEPERPAALPDAAQRPRAAAATCRCPRSLGAVLSAARVGRRRRHPRRRALGRHRAGWRPALAALRRLPHDPGQVAAASACSSPRRRCAASATRPSTARSSCRSSGTPLDDDIVQTAGPPGRRGGRRAFEDDEGATIEALWVFEVPMSLPIDAALPEAQLKRARAALARAKAVGEEYEGVEVATATVRARRAGQAIVDEARRRGVQAVVLARRGAVEDPRRRAARRPRRPAGQLRGGGHQVRDRQGAVPGHPHRAARRATSRRRAAARGRARRRRRAGRARRRRAERRAAASDDGAAR